MATLVTNIPPIQCYVLSEFVYNHEQGGLYYDCFWVTAKSIPSRALLIECYIQEYGALYDKIPISGYVWKKNIKDPLPLGYLQMWDCLSYNIETIYKDFLRDKNCRVLLPNKTTMGGQYMFTVDTYGQYTLAETPNEHKSYNFIKLDNGQFCCYPNNRIQFLDKSFTPANPERPDFKTCTKYYYAEDEDKLSYYDATEFMYTDSEDGAIDNK